MITIIYIIITIIVIMITTELGEFGRKVNFQPNSQINRIRSIVHHDCGLHVPAVLQGVSHQVLLRLLESLRQRVILYRVLS